MTVVAGRTAFITGGANGIGLGIARAFAHTGTKLALADLDASGLAQARLELSAYTAVETIVLDVRDREGFARAADHVEAVLGPVTLLFNNAGISATAPAAKLTYALWDWAMGINLNGVINGVQTFLPRMFERGQGGHIVNTASGAGLAEAGVGVLYHAAKYAVVGMSEALRPELRPLGIGVSVLCPGPVATGIIERTQKVQPQLGAGLTDDEQERAFARSIELTQYLERGVSPDRVGQMVLRAVQEDQFYIHTDRTMFRLIEARTRALLEAMPNDDAARHQGESPAKRLKATP